MKRSLTRRISLKRSLKTSDIYSNNFSCNLVFSSIPIPQLAECSES
uniref:Uncharacterized protein n=1 Tax=Arundo donax TaxID=35708 RepID=A0A0A8ZCE3_ARUDO